MSAEVLAEVAELAAEVKRQEANLEATRQELGEAMAEAVELGASVAEVAKVAGVSRQRANTVVRQVRERVDTLPARSHARKQEPALVRVNDPDTVPAIPDTARGVTSGVVSLRERHPYGRQTMFVDVRRYPTIGEVLQLARRDRAGRVYLTGPPPLDPSTGATQAEQVRAWAMGEVPAGWTHGDHYLADPTLPVCRYVSPTGDKVTVMRAAMWWGETDADSSVCREAWVALERELGKHNVFHGAGLADTPATTGRALWLRTIPEDRGYEVMAPELRELVAETSGQGRIELRPQPRRPSEAREDFTYLDGRFMYAALTWGMPIGPPALWTADQLGRLNDAEAERLYRGRGRWRVTATVPDTWSHVGLLMAPAEAGGWCYPYVGGQTFTTWADGSEVWLAMCHGWSVEIHEGMSWREGKPLNSWRDKLVETWTRAEAAGRHGHAEAALVAKAVRSILLHAIGAFAARSHPITRTAPVDSNPEVPAGTEVRMVGDNLVWQEPARQSAWTERTAHPEWSATVWARARVRLAEHALRLDPAQVVAFATDALYVAGGVPDWPDDGKPGAFRSKGTRPGTFTWPDTYPELYLLRDEAENHGE